MVGKKYIPIYVLQENMTRYLPHLEELILGANFNTNIYNSNIDFLKDMPKLHTVTLQKCNIGDESLEHMYNIKKLAITGSSPVTDIGIKYLQNVEELDIRFNKDITDDGLKSLNKLKVLNIKSNRNITHEGINKLPNIERVYMRKNTEFDITKLVPIKKLYLYNSDTALYEVYRYSIYKESIYIATFKFNY